MRFINNIIPLHITNIFSNICTASLVSYPPYMYICFENPIFVLWLVESSKKITNGFVRQCHIQHQSNFRLFTILRVFASCPPQTTQLLQHLSQVIHPSIQPLNTNCTLQIHSKIRPKFIQPSQKFIGALDHHGWWLEAKLPALQWQLGFGGFTGM